jgi:filamentous hemagglutinin family protein
MLDKINNKWQWLSFLLPGILFPWRIALAAGGITTDGTVGPAQSLTGANVAIPQNLGTTVGKNLFHSFDRFNVNAGQTVTFTENAPHALDNVISRVTGGSRSDINGTLRSTPSGHANLYLVNPSGIVFGQNARIDVAGAFHASTADEVRFQDGAKFSASQPSGSVLTAAAPASFGFLGTSSATNGLLKVDGAQLAAKVGQKLDMVGRNISVENGATLSAPTGEVRLEAVGKDNMNIPIAQPSKAVTGTLALTRSTVDVSGEGGGKVIIRGSDLKMDQNAKILANTNGKRDGTGIDVHLIGNMTIKRGGTIMASTFGSGAAGNIHVTAKSLLLDGQTILNGQRRYALTEIASNNTLAKTLGDGRAGNITLDIADQLSLIGGGLIISAALGSGDTGNVTVRAGQLLIDGQGAWNNSVNPLFTGIVTHITRTLNGRGGNITVAVRGDVDMKDDGRISARAFGSGKGGDITVRAQGNMAIKGGSIIDASTGGTQNAGNIYVKAKNLSIDGQTVLNGQKTYLPTIIGSTTNYSAKSGEKAGNGGNIALDIADQLSLMRGGKIHSSSFGSGDAGNVIVDVGQFLFDGQGITIDNSGETLLTGIITQAVNAQSGRGGDIAVTVRGDMAMKGGGEIDASTFGAQNAGNIYVTAKNLLLDGQTTLNGQKTYLPIKITSNTNYLAKSGEKAGNGGNIALDIADQLSLMRGGLIISASFGSGDTGNVTVKAGQFLLDGQGIMTNNSGETLLTGIITPTVNAQSGRGGDIAVIVRGDMAMKGGSKIDASTFGAQNAGNIYVTAKNLLLDGQTTLNGQKTYLPTRIASNTNYLAKTPGEKAGNTGNITLDIADQLSLMRDGAINSTSFGSGDAGNVTVKAGQFLLDGQGAQLNPSLTGIATSALDALSGRGGGIVVAVRGDMVMKGGSIIDASTGGTQNAGNIYVKAKNLSIDGQTVLNGQKTYLPTIIGSTTNYSAKSGEKAGNGGNIALDIADQLSLMRGGKIHSSSFGSGDAGNVIVDAGQFLFDGQGITTDNSGETLLTGIITQAVNAQSGRGGDIAVAVRGDMAMKGGSKIDARSFGIESAGNIMVSADELSLEQNSLISTESISGNGGNITIQRGRLIQLINSGVKTSVEGQQGGDGGNIKVSAKNLVMETGLIQANTKAPQASGGDITLDLEGLIPSGETLIQGGDQPVDWQPYDFGRNVIQAAAPNGISGNIQSTAPQLNLSGVLANLGGPQFDTSAISQGYCALGTGSSLIRQGKGGLLPRSRDSVMY